MSGRKGWGQTLRRVDWWVEGRGGGQQTWTCAQSAVKPEESFHFTGLSVSPGKTKWYSGYRKGISRAHGESGRGASDMKNDV